MVILLKTASVRVSSVQIMQVRVQNKGKSVWKSRYDGDVSGTRGEQAEIKGTGEATVPHPVDRWWAPWPSYFAGIFYIFQKVAP